MKASELRQKEVININTGKRMGNIVDFDVDLCSGRITGIAVPAPGKFSILSKGDKDIFLPWEKIRKTGDDVVLVDGDE